MEHSGPGAEGGDAAAIPIVQRGNLKTLEQALRKQWRLGQNIVLCWSADERGLLVIMVPHYFLGNYCAGENQDNEDFIRELISGERRRSRNALFAVSRRLEVAPTFIKLGSPLSDDAVVVDAVEQMIRRYGVSYVDSRAVLLFDIVGFSLYTAFEQASQLNSLSYSLNSAYNKLLAMGIDIEFTRTTTGDGYYVWNKRLGSEANQDLFYFMLLVAADNAVARAASRGNTVPLIRTAYHVGGHYELYQAEGLNPSVFSYIVGEVTIELARMVDMAAAEQILVGDFVTALVGPAGRLSQEVDTAEFVSACDQGLGAVSGLQLSSRQLDSIHCELTACADGAAQPRPRRFTITDKHGLSRHAYNLQVSLDLSGEALQLGLAEPRLSDLMREAVAEGPADAAGSALGDAQGSGEALLGDLAQVLAKRRQGRIVED